MNNQRKTTHMYPSVLRNTSYRQYGHAGAVSPNVGRTNPRVTAFALAAAVSVGLYNSTKYAEESDESASTSPQQRSLPVFKETRKMDKKQKDRLKKIFQKFSSSTDPVSKEPLMSPQDFFRSLVDRTDAGNNNTVSPQAEFLFKMADSNSNGKIKFSDYVLLFKLLTTPESEFEMAFRMFDLNKDGTINREEFKQVMRTSKNITGDFDFDCDLMTRFFGRDGSSTLSYNQFAQFMKSLTEEIRRQEFQKMDVNRSGTISPQQFAKLITLYSTETKRGGLSQRVLSNIENISQDSGKITYAEFDALSKVMSNMHVVANLLDTSAKNNNDRTVTKEAFSRAARRATGIVISPLEVDIIFKMFSSGQKDAEGDVVLLQNDYQEFVDTLTNETVRRQFVLDSWSRDELRSDALTPLSFQDRFVNASIKVATKTLYGGIAGAIGATVVYPIDMTKTRMQNQRNNPGAPQLYKNSIDCFQQIIKYDGYRGLYRGLVPQLIGVAPEKAIKLVVNDFLRDAFGVENEKGEANFPLEVLAGMGAGASQVVFTNPIEIVKIRLQVQGELFRTTGQAPKGAITICKELGFAGLYKGATACFARDIPFSAIYFPTYEAFKTLFTPRDKTAPEWWGLLLAGTIAGGCAASSTTPFDVIKTRLQVEARAGQETYSGIMDCARKVYKSEGPKAFMKGVGPRILRSSPQFGVTLLAYEFLQRYISPEKNQKPHNLAAGVPVEDADVEMVRQAFGFKMDRFRGLFSGVNRE
ncbi:calcium-binding mitochondrial carrier protein [Acrasis kona]|uniref:Calcium-binding mitochondrial carrier protein n=1 Tax=Acrasis kona TaxID=1008807 RepID=A0AAW2ZE48_9EUKA